MLCNVLFYEASLNVTSVTFKMILTIRKMEPILDHRSARGKLALHLNFQYGAISNGCFQKHFLKNVTDVTLRVAFSLSPLQDSRITN